MKRFLMVLGFSFALLAASLSLAQNQKETEKPPTRASHSYSELTQAPESAQARVNPLQDDPDAVAAGQILFEDHCQECHGSAGDNGKHGPNLRVPEVQNATPGTLFWLLTGGIVRKGMPVWSKLPEAQRWQLVRYLKSLGIKVDATTGKDPKSR